MKTKKKDYEDFGIWFFYEKMKNRFNRAKKDEKKFIKNFINEQEEDIRYFKELREKAENQAYLFIDIFEEGNELKKYKINEYAMNEIVDNSLYSFTSNKQFNKKLKSFLGKDSFKYLCENFVGERGLVYFSNKVPMSAEKLESYVGFFFSIQEDYIQIYTALGKIGTDSLNADIFTIYNNEDFDDAIKRIINGYIFNPRDKNERVNILKKFFINYLLEPEFQNSVEKAKLDDNDDLGYFLIVHKYIELCLETLLYLKLSKTKEEHFETSFGVRITDKNSNLVEKTGIISVDKFYTTEVHVDHPFGVRGHFRNQYIGLDENGNKKHKLIWISEFEKKGYHRRATKNIVENEKKEGI